MQRSSTAPSPGLALRATAGPFRLQWGPDTAGSANLETLLTRKYLDRRLQAYRGGGHNVDHHGALARPEAK